MTTEPTDPIALVRTLVAARRGTEPADATAMTLATADASGRPSARVVLLKEVDARGFVFFTNHGGRKARELAANPFAALCFYWPVAGEQVRAEGRVERTSDAESDAYFAVRARDAQIGAWASRQSEILASREELYARVRDVEARFAGQPVPRPPFWGGYRLVPDRVELWRSRPHRLHDRVVWTREAEGWREARLYP